MKILGVDPGLQVCGYAVVEIGSPCRVGLAPPNISGALKPTLLEAGVLRTAGDRSLETRLNQIADDARSLLEHFRPDVVAVEELYSHYAHPKTAILMGHARGVILQKCAEAGVEVKSFSATRIKKSLTGNGRASKEQVQRMIQTVLALPELPEPSDVADAIAAALCCGNSLRPGFEAVRR